LFGTPFLRPEPGVFGLPFCGSAIAFASKIPYFRGRIEELFPLTIVRAKVAFEQHGKI
jgi:hypothetical protein